MEINRKNTNTFSVSLIDRCSLIERERKKEENESLRLETDRRPKKERKDCALQKCDA